MMKSFKCIFKGTTHELFPKIEKYTNNRRCLMIVDITGSPFCRASVNLPDESLEEGEIFVRDSEENEGMLGALIEAGIVSSSKRKVQINYIFVHVVDLLI